MKKSLNRILHQPIRTRIIAYLISNGSCDYSQLKKALDLSDGHMTTHMRELIENGYVSYEKAFIDNKPKTTYHLTGVGKTAFAQYIDTLKKIIILHD